MKIREWFAGLPLALLFLAAAPCAFADGFDAQYKITQGDFDADGDLDFYVVERPKFVLIDFDIAIPVPRPPRVAPFVLLQGANKTFSVQPTLSGLNLTSAQPSPVKFRAIDVNLDGHPDAVLTKLASAVAGADDQVVFAGATPGVRNTPAGVRAIDASFKSFFTQVQGWFQNPSYFEITAFNNGWYQIIEGDEYLSWWDASYLGFWGFELNGNRLITEADRPYDGTVTPASCSWGTITCRFYGGQWQLHVIVRERTLNIDYSHFNSNARSFAQQLGSSVDNDDLVAGTTAAGQVGTILTNVLGTQFMRNVLSSSQARLDHEQGFPQEWLGDYRLGAVEQLVAALGQVIAQPDTPDDDFDTVEGVDVVVERIPVLEKGVLTQVHGVVLHRTAGSTLAGALTGARSSQNGTHFYIDKNGVIHQVASLDRQTNHVGKIKSKCKEDHSSCTAPELQAANAVQGVRNLHDFETAKDYPHRYPGNADSIGIEVVAEYDAATQTWAAPTAAQQQAITTLVDALRGQYGLSDDDIYHHDEISYKQPGEGAGLGYDD